MLSFLRDGGTYEKRRLLSLLDQITNSDTEESGDIFDQFFLRFTESVLPVAAGSAHQAEYLIGGGL